MPKYINPCSQILDFLECNDLMLSSAKYHTFLQDTNPENVNYSQKPTLNFLSS